MLRSFYLKYVMYFFIIISIGIAGYFLFSSSMTMDKNTSLLINVAGRERMLLMKINKKAIEMVYMKDESVKEEILETEKEFQENLEGLISVKERLSLDHLAAKDLDTHLKRVEHHWLSIKTDTKKLLDGNDNQELLIGQINAQSDEMIRYLDVIVSLIERKGNQNIQGLTTENIVLTLLNILFIVVLIFTWRLFVSLSKSERKYRLLIDHSPIGIMIVKDEKVNFLNDYARKILGCSKENTIIGGSIFSCIHPSYFSKVKDRLDNVYLQKGAQELTEEKWIDLNGNSINVEVITIPFVTEGGNTSLTVFRDITAYKQSKNEMEHIYKELNDIKAALDRSSIVEIANNDGVIQYVNDRFCELAKYHKEELLGKTYRIINSGYHSKEFFQELWQTIKSGRVWEGQVRNRAKDGSLYWVDTTIIPFINSYGKPYQYLTIRNDITERKKVEEEMKIMATHDHLTHLSNRTVFEYELQQAIERKESVAVLFLDLDRFKYINDSLGHSIGDKLLKLVANRLKKLVDKNAIVSRQGGDEFTILVRNNSKDFIGNLAKEIIEKIKQPYFISQKEIVITCSIGISFSTEDGDGIDTLMRNADIAMYWSKENGKDGYSFYEQFMKEKSDRIMNLELDLRKAIENEEFMLFYQPKMDLRTDEIIGCEALIRWNHPTLGIVSPAEFIPLAEETGLINQIGEWVIRESCKQNKKWHEAGFKDFVIGVNISAHQFKQDNLVEMIESILTEINLDARFLELEITETISMLSEELVLQKLNSLKTLGVSIAVDDFGTGYSSLQYLNKLPVDTLKIDKSFIDNIGSCYDVTSYLMTNAIINLARSLNMRIVAEGIETGEQMNYLKQYQCDIGQGYYISRPLIINEFEDFLWTQLNTRFLSTANSQ